jgi:5-formyltetrahydrofolate cyclo-ligase
VAHAEPGLEPHPAEDKAALRRTIRARRDAVDPAVRAAWSASALARVVALDSFRQARGVLAYAPFGSEVDTRALLRQVLDGGRLLALPRIERARRRLALHQVRNLESELAPGPWGIPEPVPGRCRPVGPGEIDFVLVPGLVFDPSGGRLGYGAGYYDRLLAAWPAPSPPLIAAAFELQVVPAVPVLSTDRRVDLVVTESRTYPARRLDPPQAVQEDR